MRFKQFGSVLVDLKQMYLVDTIRGMVYQVDFDEMVFTKITAQNNSKHPIRYDENENAIMVWKQRHWQKIDRHPDELLFMFNSRVEAQLLEESDD